MTSMKEKIMELMRLSSLFLWLLLSLVALQDSTSLALKANVMLPSSNQGPKQSHQESCTKSKELKASKMNEEDVVQVKKSTVTSDLKPVPTPCCNRGKGELNLDCELSKRSLPSRTRFMGLIPFSSDYHFPKSHPPKNN